MTRKGNIFSIYLISFFIIIHTANAVKFTLDQGQPKLSLTFQTNGIHTFYIISSGQQQHDISCIITYNDVVIFNKIGNDLEFKNDYGQGKVTIDISSSNGAFRDVSFDFQAENDPLVNIIDKKDIKYVQQSLAAVYQGLETVSRNQQFHIQRDESHKVTLQQSQNHIKWTGIAKIAFLLLSALIQLWIMKSFFKGAQNHPYQPVQS